LVVSFYFTFWNKKSSGFYLDFNLHRILHVARGEALILESN